MAASILMKLVRRVDALERKLELAHRKLDKPQGQIPSSNNVAQVRFAKTTKLESSADYPDEGNETAFGLMFQDATFTEAEGKQVATTVDQLLATEVKRVGLTVPPMYLDEDTEVLVAEIDGQHYIFSGADTKLIKANVGDDAIPPDSEGDILILGFPEDIEIGVWDWAHGNLTIEPGTEIWVQLRDDGKYDIVGVDCVGVTQGTGGGQILIP